MTAGQWEQVWYILDVFTQTDGPAVPSQSTFYSFFFPSLCFVESTGPRPPPTWAVIFSQPALFVRSVPKPAPSHLVWEWQGSQGKLTPVSLYSLKQGQALAQLSQSLICPSVCQARLLSGPLTLVSRALLWWSILMPWAFTRLSKNTESPKPRSLVPSGWKRIWLGVQLCWTSSFANWILVPWHNRHAVTRPE